MKIITHLSKREKIVMFLAASIVVFSLIYNFLIEPLYKRYAALNQELLAKRIKFEKSFKLIKDKSQITKDYNKFVENLKLKASDEEEVANLLTQIESIARKAGVRIADIKPQAAKDKGFYKKFNVEVKIESKMPALTQFIYDIINSPQILKVERLQINSKGAGSDLLDSTINISRIGIP